MANILDAAKAAFQNEAEHLVIKFLIEEIEVLKARLGDKAKVDAAGAAVAEKAASEGESLLSEAEAKLEAVDPKKG